MYLLVDYREGDFIKYLSQFVIIENDIIKTCTIDKVTLKFKITNLQIGDFIIQEQIDDANTILLCIERKTTSDLCASIKDSRFREQKTRLLDCFKDPNKICYLIDGSLNKTSDRLGKTSDSRTLPKATINGAILNLIFKHNYKVVTTDNTPDTIMTLYKKFLKGDFEKNTTQQSTVKMIKRSEKIKSEKFLNQLCLISGVSPQIAECVIKKLSSDNSEMVITTKLLIDLYNNLGTETEKHLFLADVQINCKRKLGKALSKKIYEFFCI